MWGLKITQDNLTNQQAVVKNEVKVNVMNQPYGGFPWLDLPQTANTNWHNAHNFYGDFADLDAATLDDVQQFFKMYYAPNNAVLVVTGDIDTKQTLGWVRKYFAGIPASPKLPTPPDVSEPRQEQEKRASREDPLATRPAVAVGYHVPRRDTPEYYAMGLIDELLVKGTDSRFYDALVRKRGFSGSVQGGINLLGNMFDVNGPTLWTVYLIHDADKKPDDIVAAIDAEIARLQTTPVTKEELELALVKRRSRLYADQEQFVRFGRANLLAVLALFDDDPGKINRLEDEFRKVTPALIQQTAKAYLRPGNRTILTVIPKPKAKGN
jgi:predicted Zn-dependent peptidase